MTQVKIEGEVPKDPYGVAAHIERTNSAIANVDAATSDAAMGVGHSVPIGSVAVIGNTHSLSSLAIDAYGRIWKQTHGHLICVLDLRDLAHAIDAGMRLVPAEKKTVHHELFELRSRMTDGEWRQLKKSLQQDHRHD